jgi:redox-sensitive bicupin YhaK (pirin superfamily)
MDHWDIRTLDVEPHRPQILDSDPGSARAIAINLPAGERLQEHEVHERTYLVVVDGEISVESTETVTGGPGTLMVFAAHERREVTARSDARLLLVLAPWPGEGHPGARDA